MKLYKSLKKTLSVTLAMALVAGGIPVKTDGFLPVSADYVAHAYEDRVTVTDAESLLSALSAAPYSTIQTIILGADITVDQQIEFSTWGWPDEHVTLDLNGHVLTCTTEDPLVLENRLTFDICDSSSAGNGKITFEGMRINVWDESALILQSGTIECTGDSDFISVSENCKFIMYGGTISGLDSSIYSENESSSVNIYGGTVKGAFDGELDAFSIYGGCFSWDISNMAPEGKSVYKIGNYWCIYESEKELINDFNILADMNPTFVFPIDYEGDIAITRADGVLDLDGKTINGTLMPQNTDPDKTLVLKNGTIKEIDGSYGFDKMYKGKVVFEDITLTNNLWTDGHDITINSGSYNNILCYKAADESASLIINGGTIRGTITNGGSVLNGYAVNDNGQYSIVINGGTFSFDPSEYVGEGHIVLNDGDTWTVIGIEKVEAKTYMAEKGNIEYYIGSNGRYYVLDGTEYVEVEEDYVIIPSQLEAFNSSAEENPTLLFSGDHSGELVITRDDGVIDLNGHTLTGNLLLQNNNPDKTLTIKNGTIKGELDSVAFWDDFFKGKVVLEDVDISEDIWGDGHDYTIKSGTFGGNVFSLKNADTTGSITITGGTFNKVVASGFTDFGQNLDGGTISISGGVFAQRPAAEFMAEGYNAYWNGSSYVVSVDELTEMTSKLANPSFETGNTDGWEFKHSGNDSGAKDAYNDIYKISGSNGGYLFNTWNNGLGGWNIHQTVSGLSNGKYRLMAVVASTNGNQVALRANGMVSKVTTSGDPVGIICSVDFYVTDGTAIIVAEGVNNVWFKCDDFRLFYIDDSQPESLPTEENDYTSYIVNPDFEYGTGFGWTFDNTADVNNIGAFYGVSPFTLTGQSGDYIFNSWNNGTGYPIYQTVTGLPKGRYQLSAVVGPANSVVIKGNGQTSEAGEEGEAVVEFDVTDGTAVIGAEGVDGSWFKADNFRLVKIEEKEEEIIISAEPQDITADEETTAKFSVEAASSYDNELSYQWQVSTDGGESWNDSGLSGNKTATLSVLATAAREGYMFRCVITSSSGIELTSSAATLSVVSYISYLIQPVSQKITKESKVKFIACAESFTGSTLSYQWQVSTNGGKTWRNSSSSGNKSTILIADASAARNNYRFRCVVTDAEGHTLTSAAAKLTTAPVGTDPITVKAISASQTAAVGKVVKYMVSAESSAGAIKSYQWQVSKDGGKTWKNSGLSGNKTEKLCVRASEARNGYRFRCVITDEMDNKVETDVVSLTVK